MGVAVIVVVFEKMVEIVVLPLLKHDHPNINGSKQNPAEYS
jgi:hypothetical protein